MKATEFRIGNLVDLYGKIATVQRDDFCQNKTGSGIAIDQGKPMPLTEEWILKFGFKKEYHELVLWLKGDWCIKFGTYKNDIYLRLQANGYYEFEGELDITNTCKHVHQLQNLYFALTDEELKLIER